jgi:hypothetical protein
LIAQSPYAAGLPAFRVDGDHDIHLNLIEAPRRGQCR